MIDDLLNFYTLARNLKYTKRRGWVKRKVPNSESVADHSYMVTIIVATLASRLNRDVTRCMQIAIIHDVVESMTGDIIALTPAEKARKHQMEAKLMGVLVGMVENGQYYLDLFLEYEAQETLDAQFVKVIDLYETLQQAHDYIQRYGRQKRMQDIIDDYSEKIASSPFASLLKAL